MFKPAVSMKRLSSAPHECPTAARDSVQPPATIVSAMSTAVSVIARKTPE